MIEEVSRNEMLSTIDLRRETFVLFDLPAIVYGIVISAVLLFLITPFAKDAKEVNVEVGTE